VLINARWQDVAGLRHGFLDKNDSTGGPWSAVLARLGTPLPVAVPRQVHGTHVVMASADGVAPQADGLVVCRPGLLAAVVTADCAPVLLVDPDQRVAAAVHAGWRGAAAGVLESALTFLRAEFGVQPRSLSAAIGPAVGGCCYEVGLDVQAAFRARSGETTVPAWETRAGRRYLDLRAALRLLLQGAGVTTVETLGPCTVCSPSFHSYRRDGAGTGRQLSFVGWA
jgi:YfiH family protein